MQIRLGRRAFLKAGGVLLSCRGLSSVLGSAAVYESVLGTVSLANPLSGNNSLVLADSLTFTVDSTLILISDGVFPPIPADSDGDGLIDLDEVTLYGTDYLDSDTDNDGLSDGEEVTVYGTEPLNPDTDGDSFPDGFEVTASTDPFDDTSFPLNDGDINLDGQVNAADSLLATRIIHGDVTVTPEQLQHADVAPLINGFPGPDGKVTTGDLVVIMRKALGLVNF